MEKNHRTKKQCICFKLCLLPRGTVNLAVSNLKYKRLLYPSRRCYPPVVRHLALSQNDGCELAVLLFKKLFYFKLILFPKQELKGTAKAVHRHKKHGGLVTLELCGDATGCLAHGLGYVSFGFHRFQTSRQELRGHPPLQEGATVVYSTPASW